MSEFKFSCPACGQNILCDAVHEGTELACPVCNATIVVPKEAAGSASVSTQTQTGIPSALPGDNAIITQKTSGLAVASLVCSLSSLVTCVGWLPGIICGHLAKSRIRRDPSLKGSGLASAGLIIAYLILVLEVGTAAVWIGHFTAVVKQGILNVQQDLATNNVIIAQTQSTTNSNDSQQIEPVKPETVATGNQQIKSSKSEWTSDINKASVPDHPVDGKLHGIDFIVKTASFKNGSLKISSANGMSLDIRDLGASIAGQSYEIQSVGGSSANPHIKVTWNEGGVIQSETYSQGYGMKLQFGPAINRKASAKIYLCFPDDSKSYAAGKFEVRLGKQK